jgi:hypothetical protein
MSRSKPAPTFQRHIEFLGEQDGVPERELKGGLSRLLNADPAIMRAYLAIVRYGDSGHSIALCLASKRSTNLDLANRIGELFREMFKSDECLDILWVSKVQEQVLANVCKPFYG